MALPEIIEYDGRKYTFDSESNAYLSIDDYGNQLMIKVTDYWDNQELYKVII